MRKNTIDLVRSMYGQLELIFRCKYNSKTRQIRNYVKLKGFRMQLFARVNEQMISLNLFHFWFYDFCRLNHVVYF